MDHSDRESQSTNAAFMRLVALHDIQSSLSRAGNVRDKAVVESFSSSPKTERATAKNYRSRDAARANVFDYIERFHNPRRRHS